MSLKLCCLWIRTIQWRPLWRGIRARESAKREERRQVKKKRKKERKRERKRRRRSWDRESWGRKRMRRWMERRGNYAARRGNWQVENFERRDLQRRSWDLVTNKGGFRRIRRRGADKKLQNSQTVFLRISYLTYSREGEGHVQIYMESWSLPGDSANSMSKKVAPGKLLC